MFFYLQEHVIACAPVCIFNRMFWLINLHKLDWNL